MSCGGAGGRPPAGRKRRRCAHAHYQCHYRGQPAASAAAARGCCTRRPHNPNVDRFLPSAVDAGRWPRQGGAREWAFALDRATTPRRASSRASARSKCQSAHKTRGWEGVWGGEPEMAPLTNASDSRPQSNLQRQCVYRASALGPRVCLSICPQNIGTRSTGAYQSALQPRLRICAQQ